MTAASHVAPVDNLAPLRFETRGFGRQVAMLHQIEVGEVQPWNGRRGFYAACWLRLPEVPRSMFPATSVESGKMQLAQHVREWIAAAGLRV